MALALEGIDLVALLAVVVLIGLLTATAYTFERLAGALDVDIFGYRPFAGIASAIQSYVVGGLNEGIAALEHVAVTLWHWSSVAIDDTVDGLLWFVHHVGTSIEWVVHHAIPDAIKAAVEPVTRIANDALNIARSDEAAIQREVTARIDAIDRATVDTLRTVNSDLHALQRTIEGAALDAFPQLARDVEHEIANAVSVGLASGEAVASTLAGAAEEALTSAERVGSLTADELRELLNNLKAGDVAKLIGTIPVIAAALTVLETETGLSRQECRQKIKGICGTDPLKWLHFLAGLAFVAEWEGLEAFAEDVADGMGEVVDAITALVGV